MPLKTSNIKTPKGNPALGDGIMQLACWSAELAKEGKHPFPIISAAMGKPTFPISLFATQAGIKYWHKAGAKAQRARHLLSSTLSQDDIAQVGAAIDYGNPQGDEKARREIAEAFTKWYNIEITADNILFTVGGAGALHSIFSAINKLVPDGAIVTPFPHYSLYTGPQGKNKLFPISVMKAPGYKLTAEMLNNAIIHAKKQNQTKVSAVLLCEPNNPLGTALNKTELIEIAAVLDKHSDVRVIVDEAYAEMRLTGEYKLSLLSVASPALRERIILLRSGTKGLGSAGERMAATITFDPKIMDYLVQETVNMYGHTSRSSQYIYTEAIKHLMIDGNIELQSLRSFYTSQVELVENALKKMGIAMSDSGYKVKGAFYVLADLHDLFGGIISTEAGRALGKEKIGKKITTDEELAYSLLFDNGLAIAPLSYFGISNTRGYMRITCSCGPARLQDLMMRLEKRLIHARQLKQEELKARLKGLLTKCDPVKAKSFTSQINATLMRPSSSPLELKESNECLSKILTQINELIPKLKESAAIIIQSCFRDYKRRKKHKNEMDAKWRQCVDAHFADKEDRTTFYTKSYVKRLAFTPWKNFLNSSAFPPEAKSKSLHSPPQASRSSPSFTALKKTLSSTGLFALPAPALPGPFPPPASSSSSSKKRKQQPEGTASSPPAPPEKLFKETARTASSPSSPQTSPRSKPRISASSARKPK